MAGLEQRQAGAPMPSSGSMRDGQLGSGRWASLASAIRPFPPPPEPSFQFQAEKVLGSRLPRLG